MKPLSYRQFFFIWVGFLFISLGIYWRITVEIPRADHIHFLNERRSASSDSDFFVKSLSYSRTRTIHPGDQILYRPAMTGTLALIEIFFPHAYIFRGFFVILGHSLVCICLFYLLVQFATLKISALISLFFCAQYAGMDMLLTRHLSPYILSLIPLSLGVVAWHRYYQKPSIRLALLSSSLIFVSLLFFELNVLGLMLAGLAIIVTEKKQLAWRSGMLLIAPAVAYLLLNVCDGLWYGVSQLAGTGDKVPLKVGHLLESLCVPFGAFLAAFAFPFTIQFKAGPPFWMSTARLRCEFKLLGQVLVVFLALAWPWGIFQMGKLLKQNQDARRLVLLFTCLVFTLVLVLAVGRAIPRGLIYLRGASYYYYIANFFGSVVFACLIHATLKAKTFKYVATATLLLFIINIYKIQSVGSEYEAWAKPIGKLLSEVGTYFQADRNICYSQFDAKPLSEQENELRIFVDAELSNYHCLKRTQAVPTLLRIDGHSVWAGQTKFEFEAPKTD